MSNNLKPSRITWQDLVRPKNARGVSKAGSASAFASTLGAVTQTGSQVATQTQSTLSTAKQQKSNTTQQPATLVSSNSQPRVTSYAPSRRTASNPVASTTATSTASPQTTLAAPTLTAVAAQSAAPVVATSSAPSTSPAATGLATAATSSSSTPPSTPVYVDPYQPNLDWDQVPRENVPPALLDWYDKRKASIAAANMPEVNATAKAHWDWRDDMVRGGILPAVTGGPSREDILQGMSSWGVLQGILASTKASPNGLYTLSDLTARQLSSAEPEAYVAPINGQAFAGAQPTPAPPTWTPAPAPEWDADGKPVITTSTPAAT